jgi:hypothetical protein
MQQRILMLTLMAFGPLLSAGCFQELDPGAASEPPVVPGPSTFVDSGLIYAVDGKCPTGMVTGGSDGVNTYGVCIPQDTSTPDIELINDASTPDPCVAVQKQADEVRTTFCAVCHGGGPGQDQGSFHSILDDSLDGGLINHVAPSGAIDPTTKLPFQLIIPGKPEFSRVYQRITAGLDEHNTSGMPPVGVAPRPTAADCSVLYSWIMCLGGGDSSGSSSSASASSSSSGGGGGGAAADAGAPRDSGSGG